MHSGWNPGKLHHWLAGLGLLAGLSLSACAGQRSSVSRGDLPALLPPFPQDSPAAGQTRRSAGVETLVIDGRDEYQQDPAASDVPTGLRLSAPAGGIGWAIYQVPGLDLERYVTSVDLTEAAVSGSYWIALADYSAGRWAILEESSLLAEGFSVADPAAATGPGGNLYFALIVSGSTIVHQQATAHIQNNAPPVIPPPTGLAALPGDAQVTLTWDTYTDPAATALNVYQSDAADMAGAVPAGTEPLPGDNSFVAGGLTNGATYYFALKATDGGAESDFGNIVSATPAAAPAFELGGIWGRLGKDAAGTSQTARLGPLDFSLTVGVDLTSHKPAGLCRTSPAVDSQGNVYALSRDGVFSSWTGDLAGNRFSLELASLGGRGAQRIPPQAPCIDAADNVYFASVDDDTGDLVFWGFTAGGTKVFDVDYPGGFTPGGVDDNEQPFPSLNIAGGVLVSASDHYQCPLALNPDGSEAWKNAEYIDQLYFSAEPAWQSTTDSFEWPVTFFGLGIDPRRHWMSLEAGGGGLFHDYKAMGGLPNPYGGIALPSGRHFYPEYSRLVLLDSASGGYIYEVDLGSIDNPSGSPALDPTGEYLYQPVYQDEGFVILGKLNCYGLHLSVDPPLDFRFSQAFDFPPLTGRPAVDAGNHVYFADEGGTLYRLTYLPELPVGDGNPSFSEFEISPADTYKYSSFALTDGAAYICSEQNQLYVVGNPFLD